jgi:hypothetical protein
MRSEITVGPPYSGFKVSRFQGLSFEGFSLEQPETYETLETYETFAMLKTTILMPPAWLALRNLRFT